MLTLFLFAYLGIKVGGNSKDDGQKRYCSNRTIPNLVARAGALVLKFDQTTISIQDSMA